MPSLASTSIWRRPLVVLGRAAGVAAHVPRTGRCLMERRGMRWLLVGLIILTLSLQPTAAGAEPTERGVYIAMGDSLARGIGATDPDQLGYVPRLFDFYRGTDHAGVDTLVNVAVRGATSRSLIAGGQLTNALTAINDPATDVRVVTLEIGGNDLVAEALAPGSPCPEAPSSLAC